jgi:hypothetical protein
MIKLKEQAIRDIGDLNSIEVSKIYELIRYFKDSKTTEKVSGTAYLKVREALQSLNGSLSDEISLGREEIL